MRGTDSRAWADLALATAREAVAFIRERRPEGRVEVADTKSSPTDVVTVLDRQSEELIRARILRARPDDGFVGEEGDDIAGTSGLTWVVDPIDGTVNFMYGIPASAVAIAVQADGRTQAAVVVNISTEEAYVARAGAGAWRVVGDDWRPLHAPQPPDLAHCLIGTGFNYVPEVRARQARAMAEFLPLVRDIRRIGSAALDLCAVADGRLDAFVEQGLQPWDLIPGGLIAREAGLEVTGLDGPASERLTVAAHPRLVEPLLEAVRTTGL